MGRHGSYLRPHAEFDGARRLVRCPNDWASWLCQQDAQKVPRVIDESRGPVVPWCRLRRVHRGSRGGRRGTKTAPPPQTTGCATPPGGVGVKLRLDRPPGASWAHIMASCLRTPLVYVHVHAGFRSAVKTFYEQDLLTVMEKTRKGI